MISMNRVSLPSLNLLHLNRSLDARALVKMIIKWRKWKAQELKNRIILMSHFKSLLILKAI